MEQAPVSLRALTTAFLGAFVLAMFTLYAIGFDQGALAAPVTDAMRDSGGALHELFHDARHVVGIPCH
ncbi:MAG: CbtB domain-containing protein [Egibacteraceae bacterium]